jgi:hypothetical protein
LMDTPSHGEEEDRSSSPKSPLLPGIFVAAGR